MLKHRNDWQDDIQMLLGRRVNRGASVLASKQHQCNINFDILNHRYKV